MLLGYNTNGFAHHRLEDALEILAELGYQSVAITLDYQPSTRSSATQRGSAMKTTGPSRRSSACVPRLTGSRFLLDRRRKHQPTLISPTADERRRRLYFLEQGLQIGAGLGSDALSFWSGTPVDRVPRAVLMDRLVEGCRQLCVQAARSNLRLAFEPEPGMFIDTMTLRRAAPPRRPPAVRPDPRHRPSALPGRGADRQAVAKMASSPLECPH